MILPHCSVLVVEDEFLIALEIEETLTEAGYTICGMATTEQEAIRKAHETRPQLAVVDVRLASGTGINVAKVLKELGTRVLFATAHCQDLHDSPDAIRTLCIMKPYQPDKIPAALALIEQEADGFPERLPAGLIRI